MILVFSFNYYSFGNSLGIVQSSYKKHRHLHPGDDPVGLLTVSVMTLNLPGPVLGLVAWLL
jgi:hypothetical protein